VVLDESIAPLIDQAWELLGTPMPWSGWPRRTGQVRRWLGHLPSSTARSLPSMDCWFWMPQGARRIGWAPGAAGGDRTRRRTACGASRTERELQAAGYHAQVAVAGTHGSLLFLIDSQTGARNA
jgi:hypothetical protein